MVKETALDELPTELTAEYQLCHLIGKDQPQLFISPITNHPPKSAFLASGLSRLRLGLQTAGLSASFFPWPPQGDKSRAPLSGT